ncbi:DMT family transporter [Streptomyces formicae]|uniref:Permease of the drug/metabolite transporter (DMT) superfamily n=1 Tax=Streptomyces formicae TaxID=1616117 RepID=A0A291QDU7_9ACTN|nr:DMT family transporter [Streptomyces formicae]ATL29615.1 Permease of the drug/metabolite transporter (DMT) superfamily [Streptomyces formicae]
MTTRNALENRGTAQLTAAMMLSGTLGIFVVESGASAFNVVFFRVLFGALALGAYAFARGYFRDHGLTLKKLGLAALGGVFIVFNWVFLFTAYEATSISLATVVYHTQPFFLVLLSALVLRERLSRFQLGWLAAAFAGLLLVSGVRPGDAGSLAGIGLALLAALLYALSTLVTKRVTGVRPHLIALVQVLVGIPLLLPFADFGAMSGTGTGWAWLAGLGVIHTGLMYVLMYAAYAKLPTAKIAVLAFTYPAVAMVADWAVYGHHIGLVQALGVPLIVLASLKVTLAPARAARPAPRTAAPAREDASPSARRAVSTG